MVAFDLLDELESIVVALEGAGVSYAVCGGLAVILHGHVRATDDVDLLLPDAQVPAAREALGHVGFDIVAGPIRFDIGRPRERTVHRISKIVESDVLTVDLLVVTAVLQRVWEGRETIPWRGHALPTVSRSGLATMKRLAGRHQDLADLEGLGLPEEEPT
jgi:hypothetical protein